MSKVKSILLGFAKGLLLTITRPIRAFATARLVGRKLPALKAGIKITGNKDLTQTISIGSFLEQNAQERPTGIAIRYEDQSYSHAELNERSNRFANLFASRGVGKGDAVAICIENRPEILFAVAGAAKLGAIAAVINTNQRRKVLLHSLSVCKAKLFVIGEECYEAFAEIRGELDKASADAVIYLRDQGDSLPDDVTDGDAVAAEASATTPDSLQEVTLADPCFYVYTSGTTGMPKASIMSHSRWVKAGAGFGKAALNMRPSDTIYVSLPFYHNNALTVAWSSAAAVGATLAIRRKFSATKFWDDIRKYNATVFCYIGELCRYLMNQPPKQDDADNPAVKCVGNGLRPDIWRDFKKRFGIKEVYEFYGASEANVAFINLFNFDCTVGFCPAPYALVKYDIDRDEPVEDSRGHLIRTGRGDVGLLIAEVSEKYAFDGYTDKSANDKKLLRNVFEEGDVWFNSGDLLRDQGFRHAQFVDRIGDTFRWKGENVSTNEVAEVLGTFDQVDEATVFGVQIPGSDGRAGMAAIVANRPVDDFDFPGFTSHVTSGLPAYACPIFLRFRSELDMTGTFKQKKGELRKEGFAVQAGGDPIFIMLPKQSKYVPLTAGLAAEIDAGSVSF